MFSTEYGNSFDELDKLMLKQVCGCLFLSPDIVQQEIQAPRCFCLYQIWYRWGPGTLEIFYKKLFYKQSGSNHEKIKKFLRNC